MTLLLFAIAVNLASAVVSVVIAWRNHRRFQVVMRNLQAGADAAMASPYWVCTQEGHDFELDVMSMDDQSRPPRFAFTHVFRWTCRRCETEYTRTQRLVLMAPPGVVQVETSWLDFGTEETDAR